MYIYSYVYSNVCLSLSFSLQDKNVYDNVPEHILAQIYHTIQHNEIRLHTQHTADLAKASSSSSREDAVRETPALLLQRQLDHVAAVARAIAPPAHLSTHTLTPTAPRDDGGRNSEGGGGGGGGGLVDVGRTVLLYKEMFVSVWGPIVAALSVVLDCMHSATPVATPTVTTPLLAAAASIAASSSASLWSAANASVGQDVEIERVLEGFCEFD